jgi:hypothetical protein
MLVEVGSLKSVLETLQLLAESEGGDGRENILEKLEGPGGPLVGCQKAMEDLERLVPPPMIQAAGGKQNKVALCLKALAWPLKETMPEACSSTLGVLKQPCLSH